MVQSTEVSAVVSLETTSRQWDFMSRRKGALGEWICIKILTPPLTSCRTFTAIHQRLHPWAAVDVVK